ncbi:MAG: hypothetical protein JO334_16460 [Verrucomicrobia bacterium]|nr:hypothetical protein [Verrucomicrobiota bacterium]
MIRSILASSWLPLLYWGAAVVVMMCWARHAYLEVPSDHHEINKVASASVLAPPSREEQTSTTRPRVVGEAIAVVHNPKGFWSPQCFVLEPLNSPGLRHVAELETKQTLIAAEAQTPLRARATMLSIRADPPGQAAPTTLTIPCRTSVAIRNALGRAVIIDGVVTPEVVSSSGKILIMAGSRVIGSGILDPENGRLKSDGLWSIFADGIELKVRAQLLDRPAGLPGILGQKASNEDEPFQREAITRTGCPIFVPRGAPFVLQIRGEIQLPDLNSIDAGS